MEAVCWIPVLKVSKLILAGDPLQLPPTVISSNEKKGRTKTESTKASRPIKSTTDKATGRRAPVSKQAPLEKPPPSDDSGSDDSSLEEGTNEASGRTTLSKRFGILVPSKSLEITLFDRMERMWGDSVKQMLTVQYRYVKWVLSLSLRSYMHMSRFLE